MSIENQTNSWDNIINKLSAFSIAEGITSFVNPYSMLLLKNKPQVTAGVDHWYVDGISLVKLVQSVFKKPLERYSFDDTSAAPVIFSFVKEHNVPLAIIGTQKEFIADSVKTIEEKFGIRVTYYRHGFFANKEEIQQTIQEIIAKDIKVVVCGMGTPRQENFLLQLKDAGWKGYGYTCGGYLHQIAKKENYYPHFFDKYNIRWIYRIYDEPKLLKRYFIKYPQFLAAFTWYAIKKKFTKQKT